MAKSFLTALQVARLASDPAVGSSGQVYFNTTTNKFRGYTTNWQDLGSGSGGGGGSNFITTDTIAAPTEFWVGVGDPTSQAVVGDLWLDESQYDENEYIVVQSTPPTSDFDTNTLWADLSDSSLPVIPADVADPYLTETPNIGDYFVNLSDEAGQLITDTNGIAPDPTQVQYWIDDSDVNNPWPYSNLTFAQYPSFSNLPDPTLSDGMFVYVQNTGNPFYAANGAWNRIPQAVVIETSVAVTNLNLQNEQALRWMGI